MSDIQSFGDAVIRSLSATGHTFVEFLPQVLGAGLVMLVGWFAARITSRFCEQGLKMMGVERGAKFAGISDFIEKMGIRLTTSKLIAEIAKWFVALLFFQAAANVLKITQITTIISAIVLFIPNLVVALMILITGFIAARLLGGAMRASAEQMGIGNPNLVLKMTEYGIITLASMASLSQVGIAPLIVNALFIGLVAAVALGVGLAFGLGGRESAGNLVASWIDSLKKGDGDGPGRRVRSVR